MTVGELALWYEDSYGYPAANVMHTLNKIFDTGSIDEEPRTTTRTVHTLTPVFDAAPAEEESRV
jgi:hypothetical protein